MPYWFVELRAPANIPQFRKDCDRLGVDCWISNTSRMLSDEEFEQMRKKLDRDVQDEGTAKNLVDNAIIGATEEQAGRVRRMGYVASTVPRIIRDPEWFFDAFRIPDWQRPFGMSTTKMGGIALGVVSAGLAVTKALEWW